MGESMKKNIITTCVVMMLMCIRVSAQNTAIDVSGIVQQMTGGTTYFDKGNIEVKNFIGFGAGAGINFDNFNVNLDFLFGSSAIKSNNNFDIQVAGVDINLDYQFLNYQITPLVFVGIGSVTFTDSYTGQGNIDETDFSYNFGGGFRWTFTEKFYLKGVYRVTSTKIAGTTDAIPFQGVSIGLGYIIPLGI
jgi:opacity protein-like surface antigen